MLAPALLPLALSLFAGAPAPTTSAAVVNDPPVKVWLNSDGEFVYGEKAKVYAKAAQDGYMVVLYADPRGRIRVLFPVDPTGDQAVKGGKKYEIKGRGGREAFVAADSGSGLVMAAFSTSRFNVEQFAQNGHWDYRALADTADVPDPETRLMDVAHEMSSAGRYTYDMASYIVDDFRYANHGYRGHGYGPRVALGFGFGSPWYGGYYDPFVYNRFYNPFPRYGAGVLGFGYSWGGIRSFGRR